MDLAPIDDDANGGALGYLRGCFARGNWRRVAPNVVASLSLSCLLLDPDNPASGCGGH